MAASFLCLLGLLAVSHAADCASGGCGTRACKQLTASVECLPIPSAPTCDDRSGIYWGTGTASGYFFNKETGDCDQIANANNTLQSLLYSTRDICLEACQPCSDSACGPDSLCQTGSDGTFFCHNYTVLKSCGVYRANFVYPDVSLSFVNIWVSEITDPSYQSSYSTCVMLKVSAATAALIPGGGFTTKKQCERVCPGLFKSFQDSSWSAQTYTWVVLAILAVMCSLTSLLYQNNMLRMCGIIGPTDYRIKELGKAGH